MSYLLQMSQQLGGDQSLKKTAAVAVAAAATVAAGVGAYYYFANRETKKKPVSLTPDHVRMNVSELKVLGNELFANKKYADAVKVFTLAIEREEPGSDPIKALCYQNRAAAKERAGGVPTQNLIDDVNAAIGLKKEYGKAYARRAKYHRLLNAHRDAIVDLFVALHLSSITEEAAQQELAQNIEPVEALRKQAWQIMRSSLGGERPVRHERVYQWLHKSGQDDIIRRDVLKAAGDVTVVAESPYALAIQLVCEKQFDDVATLILERGEDLGEQAPECMLLAARFLLYKNMRQESEGSLSVAEQLIEKVEDPVRKRELQISAHVVKIESQLEKAGVVKAWEDAVAFDPSVNDFYTTACFRLAICSEPTEAKRILNDSRVTPNDTVNLLRLMLDILTEDNSNGLAITQRIQALEQYVNDMKEATPHAMGMLVKIYTSMGAADKARDLMSKILEKENESMHWFERSCLAMSVEDALEALEYCLSIEPHHNEANIMCAGLKMNAHGNSLFGKRAYEELIELVNRAERSFDGTVDGPVEPGVFRLKEILDAKRKAAEMLGLFV